MRTELNTDFKETSWVDTIHNSLVNGNRQQMVTQIDEYGTDFWEDYKEYLIDNYPGGFATYFKYFTDATISYFRIKNA